MTLTDPEIERMQAVGDAHLAGTAVIQRPTAVSDAGGGGSVTWGNAGTVVARFAPVVSASTADEDVEGGRMTPDIDAVITVPAGTDVRTSDRIASQSRTYEVTTVRTPQTWEINRRLEVSEVT
jgi:head-tail adaptor